MRSSSSSCSIIRLSVSTARRRNSRAVLAARSRRFLSSISGASESEIATAASVASRCRVAVVSERRMCCCPRYARAKSRSARYRRIVRADIPDTRAASSILVWVSRAASALCWFAVRLSVPSWPDSTAVELFSKLYIVVHRFLLYTLVHMYSFLSRSPRGFADASSSAVLLVEHPVAHRAREAPLEARGLVSLGDRHAVVLESLRGLRLVGEVAVYQFLHAQVRECRRVIRGDIQGSVICHEPEHGVARALALI